MKIDENDSSIRPRMLVVLEPHPESARLLRIAKRKSSMEHYGWEVLVIETPRLYRRFTPKDREQMLSLATLAEQMGALVTRRQANSMVDGVCDVLAEREKEGIAIVAIKVGKIERNHGWWRFGKPLYKKLAAILPHNANVVVVPLGHETSQVSRISALLRTNAREVGMCLLAVALVVGCVELIHLFAPEAIGSHNRNKPIVFMVACAFAAGRYGLLAGLITSVGSFLTINMLYVEPYFSLIIDDRTDAVNLGLFMLAAFVISFLGSRDYSSRVLLVNRAERFHSLFKVHRLALNNSTLEETIQTLDVELRSLLKTDVVFFLPSVMDRNKLETLFAHDVELNEAEMKALYICWQEGKTTGVAAPYAPEGCRWRFEPMLTVQDEVGVLAVRITKNVQLDADFGRLMSGIADQVALILERMHVGRLAEQTKIQAEREKLRGMLLSSVSHDLKTPLASVIGSLSVYRSMGHKLSEEHRVTLINNALEEAQRLDNFITNILDMTRIESGQIELREEWGAPELLVADVCKRLRDRLRQHDLVVIGGEDLEVCMDAMMTGQVLQNLLDNAAKYTPEGTRIEVSWEMGEGGFLLSVRDYGKGIPDGQFDKIFDKYERINRQDSQVAGTGLGLAIARAVLQAQGGRVEVSNHPEGGALFTLILPKVRRPVSSKVA